MWSKSIYKVPNGKLLKIFLEYSTEKKLINKISITGDFFAHPEESIDLMEAELKNTILAKEILLEKVSSIIKKYGIEFIGLNAEGLTQGIMMCLE
jgi:hypothetical protein